MHKVEAGSDRRGDLFIKFKLPIKCYPKVPGSVI